MVNVHVEVPRYVLNLNSVPAQPILSLQAQREAFAVIYGFSSKYKYDEFLLACRNKDQLTPYPLVRGFMQALVDAQTSDLHLVAVDAVSPDQLQLDAVTMQSIVSALANRENQVLASHALSRDVSGTGYCVQETSHQQPAIVNALTQPVKRL